MQHKQIKICLLSLLILVASSGLNYKAAASESSSVIIDMSVLDGAAMADPSFAPHAIRETPETPQSSAPSLIAPREDAQPRPHGREIISFPVKVEKRSESFDPSLTQTPAYENASKNQAERPAVNAPLPSLKPVAAIENRKKAKVPLPPRRPPINHASAAFVKKARQKAIIELAEGHIDMPAVPATEVTVEILESPGADTLASRLVSPDKQEMVKSVQAVFSGGDAAASDKNGAESATMPLPSHKPDTADISVIEPAAGILTASLAAADAGNIPREPPPGENIYEIEYISISFKPGITELGSDTVEKLEKEILPLLANNPQWRLQIQAFAGKTGNDIKNARRASLARALSVRSFLLERGIEARRMDVRALGAKTDRTPVDRVDFVFFDPTIDMTALPRHPRGERSEH